MGSTSATVSANVSGAGLRMINSMNVFQADGAGNSSTIASHNISFPVSYQYNSATVDSSGTAVFSNRDVVVTSTSFTSGTISFSANASLEAGWNLVFWQRLSDTTFEMRARPVNGPLTVRFDNRNYSFGTGSDPDVFGYSVLAAHQALAENPTVVHSGENTSPITNANVRSWVRFDVMDNDMVALGQTFPGVFNEAGVTVNPPEARGLVAAVYAFNQAAIAVDGWQTNLGSSLGQLAFENAGGNEAFYLYADRAATLTVNSVEGGTTYSTPSGGVTLVAGWNRFELVPAGANAYTVTLVPTAPTTWSVR